MISHKKWVFKQGNLFHPFFVEAESYGKQLERKGARYDVNKVDVERVSIMSNPVELPLMVCTAKAPSKTNLRG